jgi:hypothetical protein
MYKEALSAYGRAAEADENNSLGPRIKMARVHVEQGRPDLARQALETLQREFPADPMITAMLTELDEKAEEVARDLVGLAVDRFRRQRHNDSIAILNRLQRIRDPKVFERANDRCQHVLGWSVARLLATNRLNRRCMHCGRRFRDGLITCPICKGKSFFEKSEQVVEIVEPKPGQPSRKRIFTRTVRKPCGHCKGFGYVLCPHCQGAGRDFGEVGDLERPVFVSLLRPEVDRLATRLGRQLDDIRLVSRPTSEVVLLEGRRLEYFLGHMLVLDTEIKGDPLQRYIRLRDRLGDLLRETASQYRLRALDDAREYDAIKLERWILEQGILLPDAVEVGD